MSPIPTVMEFYAAFRQILATEAPAVLAEFEEHAKSSRPVDVALWLNEQSTKGLLPKSAEPLLTDFYYAVH